MQFMHIKILFVLFILVLICPVSSHAATEQRIALVIGNSNYNSGPLKNPVNDATAMAAMLKKLGFTVTLKKNIGLQEMDESIREFGRQLKKTRGVGLFYYAGHGMQIGGANYLLPVNARIEKESDVRFHSINADMVLAEMENAENGLNIVLLDACRDNPFSRSFRNAARGLAIISNAPSGTFISYSTGANQVARDGEGTHSPYTRVLLENMDKPGLSINNVFMKVRSQLKKETGQIPWELSSLEGDFFFVPGSGKTATDVSASKNTVTEKVGSSMSNKSETDALDDERRKVELEKQRLEKEETLLTEKAALEEKRRQLEEKKKQLAMGKLPSAYTANEIKRDGRFIAYDNGTVVDTKTNLMWAAKDNASDINWANAKSYCENYRGGGYTDWRLPTQDELEGLYDADKTSQNPPTGLCGGGYHVTELIHVTCCCVWASGSRNYFSFVNGGRHWPHLSERALPVRSNK